MDRKLEIAEMRVADLEFQLLDAESKIQMYRDMVKKLEDDNTELRSKVSLAAGIMTEVGLVNEDHTLMWDPKDVAQVKLGIQRGKHLEIFEKANKENPIINDAWNKYLMALRLCGLDETPETN